jgi:uncharacterized tellurite resistance protein B-like protein
MFDALSHRLAGTDTPERLRDVDARLALASLLVRAARVNGDYAKSQIRCIDQMLMQRYGLTQTSAEALRLQAEMLEAQAPDTVRFTRAIKAATPYEERERELEAMWVVILADGVRDDEESGLMRLVADFLGISDRDSALVRQRVQNGSGAL